MKSSTKWLASGAVLVLMSGCQRAPERESEGTADPVAAAPAAAVPADNTKKNERDRGETLTPMDQAENDADRTITQRVRQAVVGKDGLSTNAKNVKIITANGVVTLRGPVQTTSEKADIASIAQGTDGVTRVDNQLEIAANEPRKE